jgi:ribosomal protein L40E
MDTPGERFVKSLKQWLKDFSKTKYAIPAIIALSCLVYYAVVLTFTAVCFSNLIAPLLMLALLWKSGVRRVRKLLLIGAIATLFFSAILIVVFVTQLQHMDPAVAESIDGRITGTLDPWYVDKNEPFTFRLTANLTDPNMTVNSAHVRLVGIGTFDTVDNNHTMTLESQYINNLTNVSYYIYNFTFTASTTKPVSLFIFWVDLNGTPVAAGHVNTLNEVDFIQAPIFKDSFAIAQLVTLSALQIDFLQLYTPYAIILGMIWWTRRARRMREKQVEKWQAEQAKEDSKKPKTTSKVPSLDAAMGKTEEGFVCSECGADVPADATVCPKCGGKFE